METRPLGWTSLQVTPVAMGCWPIAGMTSLDVNATDSRRTIRAARDCGINFFDTAFCYGREGESERLLAEVLVSDRQQCVIATKAGIHWDAHGQRVLDASPARIRSECELSRTRLQTDCLDLLYLHAPDPRTPLERTAETFAALVKAGHAQAIGVSNVTLEQLQQFQAVCPVAAVQPAYNMLLRGIERDLIPWCTTHQIAVVPYWPLMKGLLAGQLPRDHQFQPGDGRTKYPMFQGTEWHKNQDLLDELRAMSREMGRSVAQIVVNWTIQQLGITSALCGAKRAYQIEESAGAVGWSLSAQQQARLAQALQRRGEPVDVAAI